MSRIRPALTAPVTPDGGSDISADPPPDSRQISVAPGTAAAARAIPSMRSAASRDDSSGRGCDANMTSMPAISPGTGASRNVTTAPCLISSIRRRRRPCRRTPFRHRSARPPDTPKQRRKYLCRHGGFHRRPEHCPKMKFHFATLPVRNRVKTPLPLSDGKTDVGTSFRRQ